MLSVSLAGRDTASVSLWQWDYGQTLEVTGLTLPGVVVVHFGYSTGDAIAMTGEYKNGVLSVPIPDMYLMEARSFFAYIYLTGTGTGATYKTVKITPAPRAMPINLVPMSYVSTFDGLVNRFNALNSTAALSAALAQTYAANAKVNAENSPKIESGTWWVYVDGEYVDTGISPTGATGAPGADGADGADGEDGVGIASIVRTSGDGSPGTTDTYTITLTDLSTETFTVYNGADGAPGQDGAPGPPGADGQNGAPGADGADGITPSIGMNGNWYLGETDTGVAATGPAGVDGEDGAPGAPGADGQSAYAAAQAGGYTDTQSAFYADLAAIEGLDAALEALL